MARAVSERTAAEHPWLDDYQRSEYPGYVNVARSKSLESRAKGRATAKGNGFSRITEKMRSHDIRLFVYVEGADYVYMLEALVGKIKAEIARRREHVEAEKICLAQLEWSVEVAGSLGAEAPTAWAITSHSGDPP